MSCPANVRPLLPVVFGLLLWIVAGCSGGPEPTYPVQGTVRLDGKPLSHGTVLFQSVPDQPEGTGFTARAAIGSDGTYRLTTFQPDDGAVAGKHRAAVVVGSLQTEVEVSPSPPLISPRYNLPSTSGLEFEVTPGDNRIDIELRSGPGP